MAVPTTNIRFTAPKLLPQTGNPPSHLKPIKKRLDRIETERVLRVIQDGIKKYEEQVSLLCMVSDDKKLFSIRDIELRELILKHQYLVKQFNTGGRKEVDVQNSLKDIFRYTQLKGIPLTSHVRIEEITESSNIQQYLRDLCYIIQHKLLTEKKEVDKLNMLQLKTMEKKREYQKTIDFLTKILQEKSRRKVIEITDKDRIVNEYVHNINIINLLSEDRNNKALNEAAKQILSDTMSLKGQKGRLVQTIIDRQKDLSSAVIPDITSEGNLRKRKGKLYVELLNWVRKYDDHMGRMQNELNGLQDQHNIDKEMLKEMEEQFENVKEKYDVIIEDKRREKEELIRKQKEFEKQVRCCQKVQAVWRGYLQRTGFKQSNKKKDKKKGGKKKKK